MALAAPRDPPGQPAPLELLLPLLGQPAQRGLMEVLGPLAQLALLGLRLPLLDQLAQLVLHLQWRGLRGQPEQRVVRGQRVLLGLHLPLRGQPARLVQRVPQEVQGQQGLLEQPEGRGPLALLAPQALGTLA